MKLVIATLLVTGLCGLCPAESGKEAQLGVWRVKQGEIGGGVCIVGAGALPQGETLRIPEVIGGKKVRAIASGAFEGRGEFTGLHLPSNLIRIGENAFISSMWAAPPCNRDGWLCSASCGEKCLF